MTKPPGALAVGDADADRPGELLALGDADDGTDGPGDVEGRGDGAREVDVDAGLGSEVD